MLRNYRVAIQLVASGVVFRSKEHVSEATCCITPSSAAWTVFGNRPLSGTLEPHGDEMRERREFRDEQTAPEFAVPVFRSHLPPLPSVLKSK
jgi:hypothetical protein